ncbi:MAG: methyl-accepting chemotaxis protein [Burkholderiales bacterium]|nr:methyl-accepting chemotaxis protein [Burkholderiales bacterium]
MFQRISHRLIFLIGVSLLGLWASSLNSFLQQGSAARAIGELQTNILPGVTILADVRFHLMEHRGRIADHMLANDPSKLPDVEKTIDNSKDAMTKGLAAYEKLIASDEDRALWEADKRAAEQYFLVTPEVLELSRKGQPDAARDLRRSKLRPLQLALASTLEKHIEYNQKRAAAAAAANDHDQTLATRITMALALGTTVVLAISAWFTYRKIVGETARANMEIGRVSQHLDLSSTIAANGKDEISELLRSFNGLIQRLHASMEEIRHDAHDLSKASSELADTAQQVVSSSQAQSDSAAGMAANVEQVTVSVNHISDRAGEANRLAQTSGELASTGRAAVEHMVGRIESIADLMNDTAKELAQLEESGKQIGAVVNVIREVAEQTNLLALNAAIEAARAGEQGRGFAVVADEVRKLAERTAGSTVEIASIVQAIQSRSEQVSGRIGVAIDSVRDCVSEGIGTRDAIQQISEAAAQSHRLVGEIALALREQSTASNAMASQVERVAQMAEENSRAAVSSTEMSSELRRLAEVLQGVVGTYRL